MLFNSPVFIFIFLPSVLLGFYVLGKYRASFALIWLILASLFFYGWWNPKYLWLIVFSMSFNFTSGYFIGHWMDRHRSVSAKILLVAGITVNLGLLGYFKYFNFFVENINHVFDVGLNFETIILPLAISFFTFQQITFLVDAYRGETRDYQFHHYALFVVFFPQLIAGPIVHHSEMMPQFLRKRVFSLSSRDLSIGISIFLLGLFKKVILADTAAEYSTPMFNAAMTAQSLTFFEAWGGALAYTFQLYFDFSGYSDMAIGLARMFGIILPLNFNSPYKAENIADFWRRWHMTLSRFLRDYVYIPLGGSRRGRVRRYVNLMTTMLLGGLWHGAGWTFVVWGGLHGLYLVVNHAWHAQTREGKRFAYLGSLMKPTIAKLVTFLCVVFAWVYFRAESFPAANAIVVGMLGGNGFLLPTDYQSYLGPIGDWLAASGWRFDKAVGVFQGASQVAWLALCFVIAWWMPNTQQVFSRFEPALDYPESDLGWKKMMCWCPHLVHAIVVMLLGLTALLSLNRVSEFLYFQF